MKLWPYILFISLISFRVSAQNPYGELNLLRKKYVGMEKYSASLTYTAYKGHKSTEVADRQRGRFEMSGANQRFVLGEIEFVRTPKYDIRIDHSFKEMEVFPLKSENEGGPESNFLRLDSILRKNDAVSLKKETSGSNVLVFDFTKGGHEYERIEIRYTQDRQITSVVLFYRGLSDAYGVEGSYKPRVEVKYGDQNFNPSFSPENFSGHKYISGKDGSFVPSSLFGNYKIITQP